MYLLVLFCVLSAASASASALPSLQAQDAPSYVALPLTRKRSVDSAAKHSRRAFSSSLSHKTPAHYTIDVKIGTPPQALSLVLDTGSSDIWAYSPGAESSCPKCTSTFYDPTKSSTAKSRDDLGLFNITYASENSAVLGYYVGDTLKTGGVSANMVLGVATKAHAGDPPGGIMGISFSANEASVYQSDIKYPGYIDSLYKQGIIAVRGYSIFLNELIPSPSRHRHNSDTTPGTIIFGGYDKSKWTGALVPFPLVEPSPEGAIELDIGGPVIAFVVGGETFSVPSNQKYTVLLDTGTTLTYLPKSQFAAIADALAAELYDAEGGLYAVSCDYASDPGGIGFEFANQAGDDLLIAVPWPEMILPDSGLADGVCMLGLSPMPDGEGFYTLGDTFLRSAYVLFNYDTLTVGLAQASYDNSCSDCVQPLIPS
ncbi:uncharacterized protein Z520_06207 [Fonsecaea multimorphosa CBS 102226]|uniref:Peptidase A1 domain-containing protein n=1 Tax=Fonsecaea multimorphosa CBS 102226 TaxID=1442371 RepID=A0A0D2JX29_9EURO|nr:uncharacterized protein Z520_06207 [Fonsecaea multimorphosa CBS 102226]KIX98127.1 hypothetical protein Z520_06207 [Fonsecaea multimorphosa CBS 102226]OAL24202.1 hypothetical protein AYO22_05862 [Fonsecaea multimorphosa]